MTLKAADGTVLTQSALLALTTVKTQAEVRVFTAPVYETFTHPGVKAFDTDRRLKFRVGEEVPTTFLSGLYTSAVVGSITPATGVAAGGVNVTVTGSGFTGATGLTIGGVAVTNFVVVNDTTITATTGAHSTGAVPLVLTDDGGNITTGNLFTYV